MMSFGPKKFKSYDAFLRAALKYGFSKKYFDRNEPLTSWTLLSPIFVQISALPIILLDPVFNHFVILIVVFETNWIAKNRFG